MGKDILIVIANKIYQEDIKRQLLQMGFSYIISSRQLKGYDRITYTDGHNWDNTIKAVNVCEGNQKLSLVIRTDEGNLKNVEGCIRSIKKSNILIPYDIIIWNSKSDSPKINGELVAVVNASSYVQKDWFGYLLEQYRYYDGKCIVGSKIIDKSGSIDHTGYILWSNAEYEKYGNGEFFCEPEYEYVRETDAVSLNGILFNIAYWEAFVNCYEEWQDEFYSSLEFSLQMRVNNLPLVVQPYSLMVVDREKDCYKYGSLDVTFYEKWKDYIKKNQYDKAEGLTLSTVSRKFLSCNMFLTDNGVAQFDTNAGHRATYNYIKIFLELGMQILYLPDDFQYLDKYTYLYQQLGIFVVYGQRWKENWRLLLSDYIPQIKYAFLNRPEIAVKYIDILKQNNDMIITHFGHDLHFLRLKREFDITGNEAVYKEAGKVKQLEYELVNKVDYTGYPSKVEVELLQKEFPSAVIQYFPLYFFNKKICSKRDIGNQGILFVGGFGHPPNIDAACWLVKEIIPILRKRNIWDKVYLVGSRPNDKVLNLQGKDIEVTGYVTDEQLERYYTTCKIAVTPLRFGAGMKGKVLEAMYHGIPLVTTDIGAEGLEGADKVILIGNSAVEIADKITEIYNNTEEIDKISKREYEYIIENFSKEQMKQLIMKQLYKKRYIL